MEIIDEVSGRIGRIGRTGRRGGCGVTRLDRAAAVVAAALRRRRLAAVKSVQGVTTPLWCEKVPIALVDEARRIRIAHLNQVRYWKMSMDWTWSHLKLLEATWSYLKLLEATWSHLKPLDLVTINLGSKIVTDFGGVVDGGVHGVGGIETSFERTLGRIGRNENQLVVVAFRMDLIRIEPDVTVGCRMLFRLSIGVPVGVAGLNGGVLHQDGHCGRFRPEGGHRNPRGRLRRPWRPRRRRWRSLGLRRRFAFVTATFVSAPKSIRLNFRFDSNWMKLNEIEWNWMKWNEEQPKRICIKARNWYWIESSIQKYCEIVNLSIFCYVSFLGKNAPDVRCLDRRINLRFNVMHSR